MAVNNIQSKSNFTFGNSYIWQTRKKSSAPINPKKIIPAYKKLFEQALNERIGGKTNLPEKVRKSWTYKIIKGLVNLVV